MELGIITIELPSVRHPGKTIGYLSPLNMDELFELVIDMNLYDPFPQAEEILREENVASAGFGYFRPHWNRSREAVLEMADRFRARKFTYEVVCGEAAETPESQELRENRMNWAETFKGKGRVGEQIAKTLSDPNPFPGYEACLEFLDLVLETIDWALAQPDQSKYYLFWSA